MAISLNTALKIAKKNPNYKVFSGEGYTSVFRTTTEKSGKSTIRKQVFDENGILEGTERRINDKYSLYSDPSSGLLGIQYFIKVKDPKALFGFRLNRACAETKPKAIGDIKAFYETQAQNMK